jgi:hypothetical protein
LTVAPFTPEAFPPAPPLIVAVAWLVSDVIVAPSSLSDLTPRLRPR